MASHSVKGDNLVVKCSMSAPMKLDVSFVLIAGREAAQEPLTIGLHRTVRHIAAHENCSSNEPGEITRSP